VRDVSAFSADIGWQKGLGTGFVTVFVFLVYPENTFVQVLGVATGVLDAGYLYVLRLRRRGRLAPPAALALDLGAGDAEYDGGGAVAAEA
jgi:hypothetical protein